MKMSVGMKRTMKVNFEVIGKIYSRQKEKKEMDN